MPSGGKHVTLMDSTEEVIVPLNDIGGRDAGGTLTYSDSEDDDDNNDNGDDLANIHPALRREALMADRLSVRLLSVRDDDEDETDRIVRKSLRILNEDFSGSFSDEDEEEELERKEKQAAQRRFRTMIYFAIGGFILLGVGLWLTIPVVIGPPNQPVGPYQLVERQEGIDFFQYYTFYEGRDSVGSNGYNMYVNQETASNLGICNVTMERDELDVYNLRNERRRLESAATAGDQETPAEETEDPSTKEEPFIYMGSSHTDEGPRNSIRLEGIRRFNRGLFIIDIRHMPTGCGVWPAFWLTDEANWPVNGEIDIVEGVNYQTKAKTALHSTKGCDMTDIPLGVMSGTWDTAQGIPDKKTGIPDMTLRYARNCFVYDPHQWLNQGCVAVEKEDGTIGQPLNDKGGGVYALEWDPMNRHIRTWVFTPHSSVPDNLVDAIRTASHPDHKRVAPDSDLWGVPYGYFGIGSGTECSASHFRHMRIVFNMAFCGSVAGNRFQMDCKAQAKKFKTCNDWIKSKPDELTEAYWKIRGVYVYEREWERTWVT